MDRGTQAAGDRSAATWRWTCCGTAAAVIALVAPGAWWSWLVALVPLAAADAGRSLPRLRRTPASLEVGAEALFAVQAAAIVLPLSLSAASAQPVVGMGAALLVALLASERRRALLVAGALLVTGLGAGLLAWPAGPAEWLVPCAWLAATGHFATLAERFERPRLAGRARREADELRALLDIAETIGRTLDPGQVMRTIARRVGDAVGTDSCSILLVEPDRENCFVVASKGHPEVDMLRLNLADYPEVRRALDTREPVVIDDVGSEPLVAHARTVLLGQGYRSLLVLPLLCGDEVLGTLFLRARRERPFDAEELRFCRVAASASANALKNALLYRDVQREAVAHRDAADRLRAVLDASPDMIATTDAAGAVTRWSRGAEAVTGLGADTVRGRALGELLRVELIVPPENEADPDAQDVRYARADGERVEISLRSAPLVVGGTSETGRVWIGRDVTRLRRVEKTLAQAERLSSLGEVVAGVAHELNNPLSGVVGYAELLRAHAADPDQIRDLDRIVESAMRCQRIVLKLLSFARQHVPEKKPHDLNDCVLKVLDLKGYHLKSSQIRTELELDPRLPTTSFDFHQLEQVLLNLLNNAEQAIASIRRPGRIRLSSGATADSVWVRVEDDGPGVPQAVRDRIFDPFFTTKEVGMGTGLGLSVSYGIVKEHGGRLELVDPEAGSGACFELQLPRVEAPAEAAVAPARASVANGEPSRLAGRRVLVAEDEPMVLELVSRVLEEAGAEVTLAHDGTEAWDYLRERSFDLVVADLRMPGLSGEELYERVSAERPELLRRFVFATGDLARPETVDFLARLPNRILHKPLEVETLRRVLDQAVAAVR